MHLLISQQIGLRVLLNGILQALMEEQEMESIKICIAMLLMLGSRPNP